MTMAQVTVPCQRAGRSGCRVERLAGPGALVAGRAGRRSGALGQPGGQRGDASGSIPLLPDLRADAGENKSENPFPASSTSGYDVILYGGMQSPSLIIP